MSLPAASCAATIPDTLRQEIMAKLAYSIGKDPIVAQNHDWLFATILADARPHHRQLDGLDARGLIGPAASASTTFRSNS